MAKKHTTPTQLYLAQIERFRKMNVGAKAMHRDLAIEGRNDAHELTSGGVSSKELRRLGHPFGYGPTGMKRGTNIKGSRSKIRNLPINRQTGRLQSGFRLTRESGGVQSFGIRNNAPYAKYILSPYGTTRMVGRGYSGIVGETGPSKGETVKRWHRRSSAMLMVLRERQKQ